MTSLARTVFLRDLQALVRICDDPTAIADTDDGRFLRRGVAVASFNLLETFLQNRIAELAAHISAGSVQFRDLPERLQRRAITQTVAVAAARLRHAPEEISDLRDYSMELGQYLSAPDRALSLSGSTWLWAGSNASAEDIQTMLKLFQIDDIWSALRETGGRLGFPTSDGLGDAVNLRQEFANFAAQRHLSAHSASHIVTTLQLRTMPDQVLRFGATCDLLASVGAHRIRIGDKDALLDKRWTPTHLISLRFVRERAKDHAEYREGVKNAVRANVNRDSVLAHAVAASGVFDAVFEQDALGRIVRWSIPAVG